MIAAVLILCIIALAAFLVVVAGIHLTEHHESLDDPARDGMAAAFARRVLGVRPRRCLGHGRREQAASCGERVRA